MNLAYCGSCGTDLQAAFAQLAAQLRSALDQTQSLRDAGRFAEAIRLLEELPASTDTRLAGVYTERTERLAELKQERADITGQVQGYREQAERALAEQEYESARQLLRRIPLGVRDQVTTDLLRTTEATLARIAELTTAIRQQLQSKTYDGLLGLVQQTLALRPQDAKLLQLRDQLQQREDQQLRTGAEKALATAKQLYQAGKYGAAAAVIQRFERESYPEPTHPALDVIQETCWLVEALKREPYLLPSLSVLADRWRKLRPQDADAARIGEELHKRLAARASQSALGARWAKPVEPTAVGIPTEYWRMPQQVELGDDTAAFQARPGQFQVAYGLALQGLQRALLPLNLLPRADKGILQRLAQWQRPGTPEAVWGIDLGQSGLKAVRLRTLAGENRVQIDAAIYVPHDAALFDAIGPDATDEILRQTVAEFAASAELGGTQAVLGFAAQRTLGRWFDLPPLKDKKILDAVAYEARMQIPIPLEEIIFAHHQWPADATATFRHVSLIAARQDHVTRLLAQFADTPLRITAIQSNCLALLNAVAADFCPAVQTAAPASQRGKQTPAAKSAEDSQPDRWPTLAALELGTESSTLAVLAPHGLRFRSVAIGTAKLDRAVMSRLGVTRQEAQRLRHHPEKVRLLHAFDEEVACVMGELVSEVRRTLSNYGSEGFSVEKLLITGGAAQQLGVLRHLVQGKGDASS